MQHDREQKFVLRTTQWQSSQIMACPSNIQQWYLCDTDIILQIAPEIGGILDELEHRGYYNSETQQLNFDDTNLTCRVRLIEENQITSPYYQITIKLYDENSKHRLRQKFDISIEEYNKRSSGIETQHVQSYLRFKRYRIVHGHQVDHGQEIDLQWKIDILQGNLDGLTLAKTEKSNGMVSCI
jgi:CYTH domain-containing protein